MLYSKSILLYQVHKYIIYFVYCLILSYFTKIYNIMLLKEKYDRKAF